MRPYIRYRPWQTVPAVVGAALPRECQDFPGGNFLVFSWQLQLLSLPKLLQRLLCNSQTQGDQVLKQSLNNFRSKMSSIAVYKHFYYQVHPIWGNKKSRKKLSFLFSVVSELHLQIIIIVTLKIIVKY